MYPSNYYELWDIQAPTGYVIAVSIDTLGIHNGGDYLHIGDGVDFFGNNSDRGEWIHLTGTRFENWNYQYFESNTSSILVVFTSDWKDSDVGFIIKCSAVRIHHGQTTTMPGKYVFVVLVFIKICDFCGGAVVYWSEPLTLDQRVAGSIPVNAWHFCPSARHFIHIAAQ